MPLFILCIMKIPILITSDLFSVRQKCFFTGLAAGAIAGGAALAGSILNKNSVEKTNARALENSKEMAKLNDMYQRKLLADTASLNKSSLQNAGLSVAALNGNAFNSVSSNSNATAPQLEAPKLDLAGVAQVAQVASQADLNSKQAKLVDTQAEKVKQDAEAQKLKNDETKNVHSLYSILGNHFEVPALFDYNGKYYSMDELKKKNIPLDDVSVVIPPSPISQEAFDIYSGRIGKRVQAENSMNSYQTSLYLLKASPKLINKAASIDADTDEQIKAAAELAKASKPVQDALVRLNNASADKAVAEKDLVVLEKSIKDWTWKNEKNTNVSALLSKMYQDGFDFSDFFKLIAAAIVKALPTTSLKL